MKIVVLAGGLSVERDVSLASAAGICAALRGLGHQAAIVDLFLGVEQPVADMDRFFAQGGGEAGQVGRQAPDIDAVRASRPDQSPSRVGPQVFDLCRAADLVFLALHGADGEDGKIQAALELLGVKYTGSGPLGSGLAMNKVLAKLMFSAAGLRVPPGQVVRRGAACPPDLPLPCFVKPCQGGSSVATTLVERAEELPSALAEVFACRDDALVEPQIKGREIQVALLGDQALPPIEIVCQDTFFDYVMKYQAGACSEICPAPLDPLVAERLQQAALTAFHALGLEVYSRADFILDGEGQPWLLEINTLPGMTATSLVPQEAAAAGISYSDLCQRIVELSLARFAREED